MAEGTENHYTPPGEGLSGRLGRGMRPMATLLAAFGALIVLAWYLTNDNSTMSMLLLLAGISVIVLAFMLYFLSPSRYLRSEVVDALALTNTLNLGSVLSSLLVESKGVYIPARGGGPIRLFIPVSQDAGLANIGSLRQGSTIFTVTGTGVRGMVLQPPGYGLFRYAQGIGAVFTPEGLENELKDVIVNGLELASSVDVRVERNKVIINMRHLADADMCASIRNDSPNVCLQSGCPVCSFVGCAVVSGMRHKARIDGVSVKKDMVTVTYELL